MRIRTNQDLFEARCTNKKCESHSSPASVYVKKNQPFPLCPVCRKKLSPGLFFEAALTHQRQVVYMTEKSPGANDSEVAELAHVD